MGAHHITVAERYTMREEIKKLSSRRLLHTSDYLTMIRVPEIAHRLLVRLIRATIRQRSKAISNKAPICCPSSRFPGLLDCR
jgi:hypothetical protein